MKISHCKLHNTSNYRMPFWLTNNCTR
uniref:Uncharacterized protein n=1 Tax=Rhizophora mucronata TaxID=61149 RepID=A0A2P2LC01_RHIMU